VKAYRETIEHIADLARLNLSDNEMEKLTSEMGNIIGFFDKLNELDTSNVKPMEHVIPIRNVFREDHVSQSYDRDKILANAPVKEDGCFKVPKIVE
jgi:aspartyl-tRNA(Asn)/glutamyl-tRNA(Gln) amidotransferase subunit C